MDLLMVNLSMEEYPFFLVIWAITWFSYKKTTLLMLSKKPRLTWELLAALLLRQCHTAGINAGTKWEPPAGSQRNVQLSRITASHPFSHIQLTFPKTLELQIMEIIEVSQALCTIFSRAHVACSRSLTPWIQGLPQDSQYPGAVCLLYCISDQPKKKNIFKLHWFY